MATRYHFEFLSTDGDEAHYRLYIDGKPDTRIHVKGRKLSYADGSKVHRTELKAFNIARHADWERAMAKYGPEWIKPWQDYTN